MEVGEQADVFRALGRFLDEEGATNIHIIGQQLVLSVSWDPGGQSQEHRAYQDHDLDLLREQGRKMRQESTGTPAGSLAEILRTLGQELDEAEFEAGGVIQDEKGFQVSGILGGRYANQLFLTGELQERSEARRAARGTAMPIAARGASIDGFGSITTGLPVYTQDDQRVGKVGEIRGRYIKIDAGLLQRAYWLPAETVASVVARERVSLATTKSQLEDHKLRTPPAES